jgi:hypothetical protein
MVIALTSSLSTLHESRIRNGILVPDVHRATWTLRRLSSDVIHQGFMTLSVTQVIAFSAIGPEADLNGKYLMALALYSGDAHATGMYLSQVTGHDA